MTGNGIYTAGLGDLVFAGGVVSYNYSKVYNITNPMTTLSFNLPANPGGSTKNGPGILVLSGANANSGGVTVNQGILALGNPQALGTGTLTMNGGALDSTVADLANVENNVQTWDGSFAFAGSQNLNLGNGPVTMTANTTLTVSNNVLTVGGPIAGTGALTKTGPGTLVLSGANTYTNNTMVGAGTLELVQPALATNSVVSISNGAVLQLDFSATDQVAGLVLNGISKSAGVYNSANTGGLITGAGSLLVVPPAPPVNPNAPIVQVAYATNTLSLAWPTNLGWTLQTNSVGLTAANQWFAYPGSAALTNVNIPINPGQTNVFFRMVYTNTP
jgi:autotransporter-associated beta strand protein